MSRPLKKQFLNYPKNAIDDLDATYSGLCGTNLYDVFTVDYFDFLLSQSGITEYTKSSAVTQQATVQKLRVLTNI